MAVTKPKKPAKKPPKKPTTPTRTNAPSGQRAPAIMPSSVEQQNNWNIDPLAPVTSLGALGQQASQSAVTQLQPQMQAIGQAETQSDLANRTRVGDVANWGGWYQQQLDNAFNDTNKALNNMITLQGQQGQAAQDSLASSLRRAGQAPEDLARMMGHPPMPGTDEQAALANAAVGRTTSENALRSQAAVGTTALGEARGLGGIQMRSDLERERLRHGAETQGFAQQRKDLNAQVPGLVRQGLQDLQQFELAKGQFGEAKAGRLFQQYLAAKEFDLKAKNQSFQEWLSTSQLAETQRSNQAQESLAGQTLGLERSKFLHQAKVDWANVGINQQQVQGTLAQIASDAQKEKNATKRAKIEARGKAIASGLEWLSGYLTPKKTETQGSQSGRFPYAPAGTSADGTATQPYQRTFNNAFQGLLNFMSRKDALTMLSHSEYSDWSKKAREALKKKPKRLNPTIVGPVDTSSIK